MGFIVVFLSGCSLYLLLGRTCTTPIVFGFYFKGPSLSFGLATPYSIWGHQEFSPQHILTGNFLHVFPKSKKQPNQSLANPKSKSSNQTQSPSNLEKQKINPRNKLINTVTNPISSKPINLEIFLGNKHTKNP